MAGKNQDGDRDADTGGVSTGPTTKIFEANSATDPHLSMPVGSDNRDVWEAIAGDWEKDQNAAGDDGNDMFTQCLLPTVEKLAEWRKSKSVLNLGAGTGILCRMFAKLGAQKVVGLDYSDAMIKIAKDRCEQDGHSITYGRIDLTKIDQMREFAAGLSEYEM